jgi:ABC-type polar amino acid transport system ATPase subunit
MNSDHTNVPAIEFRNVSMSFNDRLVLDNISFTLAQNEMIFLTGVSGSGKSVLLRLAMGLTETDLGPDFDHGARDSNPERVGTDRDSWRPDGYGLSRRLARLRACQSMKMLRTDLWSTVGRR